MRYLALTIALSACLPMESASECHVERVVTGHDVVAWRIPPGVDAVTVPLFAQYAVGVECWLVPPDEAPRTVLARVVIGGDYVHAAPGIDGAVLMCSGLDEWIQYGDPDVACDLDGG